MAQLSVEARMELRRQRVKPAGQSDAHTTEEDEVLLCGAGARDITPTHLELSAMYMGGYWGREYLNGPPAVDERNKLMVKCLIIKSSTGYRQQPFWPVEGLDQEDGVIGSAVVVSFDLVGLDRGTSERVRAALSQLIGVPPSCITVVATHTHNGPLTHASFIGMGGVNEQYVDRLILCASEAVLEAHASLKPAVADVTVVDGIDLAVCRRVKGTAQADHLPWYERTGNITLGEAPTAPAPDQAHLLVFHALDRSVKHCMWSYPCHPVIPDCCLRLV